MKRILIAVIISMHLTGCSSLLTSFIPTKPSIEATVQAGAENNQTKQIVGMQETTSVSAGDEAEIQSFSSSTGSVQAKNVEVASTKKALKSVSVDAKEIGVAKTAEKFQDIVTGDNSRVAVTQNEGPSWWMVLLLIFGWILPTPVGIYNWFKRDRGGLVPTNPKLVV
jgi:uncharacterized protein YceK